MVDILYDQLWCNFRQLETSSIMLPSSGSPYSETPTDLGPFQSEIFSAEIFYSWPWGLRLHVKIHIFISSRVCLSCRLHYTETSLCTVMTQLCLTFNCWAIARLLFLLRFPNRSNSLKAASSLVIYFFPALLRFFFYAFAAFAWFVVFKWCSNEVLLHSRSGEVFLTFHFV